MHVARGSLQLGVACAAPKCPPRPADRWFVNETYVKAAGRCCLGRAADRYGQVIDLLLTDQRDTAARRFFVQALRHGPVPADVTTDKAAARGSGEQAHERPSGDTDMDR